VDIQSRIADEMKSFSHEMDLRGVIEQVQEIFNTRDLREKLFALAVTGISGSPSKHSA
jgi:hypothetical protein